MPVAAIDRPPRAGPTVRHRREPKGPADAAGPPAPPRCATIRVGTNIKNAMATIFERDINAPGLSLTGGASSAPTHEWGILLRSRDDDELRGRFAPPPQSAARGGPD